jgi:hypothetical protein
MTEQHDTGVLPYVSPVSRDTLTTRTISIYPTSRESPEKMELSRFVWRGEES